MENPPFINFVTNIDMYTASLFIIGLSLIFILLRLTKRKEETSEAAIQDWSRSNSMKLYKNLRFQGWGLELMIVLLGCWSALMTESGMVLSVLYMLIVSVSEFSKLSISEGLFRFPRLSLILLALPALLISIAFTSESLLRVTAEISKESNKEISELQDKIKSNNTEKTDVENIILNFESEIQHYKKVTSESNLIKLNAEDILKKEEKIVLLQNQKQRVIQENNLLKKRNIQQSINNLNKSLISIDNVISQTKKDHQKSQEKLRNTMLAEVDNTGWLESKNKLRNYYDIQIQELNKSFSKNLKSLQSERTQTKLEISQANIEFQKLIPLNPKTQESVNQLETTIKKLNQELENLRIGDRNFFTDMSSKTDQLASRINLQKNRILELNEQNTDLQKKINTLKTNNMFYGIAGIFFNKQSSDLTEEEVKEFISWFIGISALGLALMPVFLFALSVLIEKSLKEESNTITLRDFFIKVLVLIKESFAHLSQTSNSLLKMAKEKRDASIEKNMKIRKLKQENKNNKDKYEHLRNATHHKKLLKKQDDFESYITGLFDKRLSDMDESVIARLETRLDKSIKDQIDKKEVSAKVTKNYISKGFLNKLLGEEDKDD
ncbi:MAG: hypothetical protein VW827_03585 [Alphaproteobacteria bacterium]